MIAARFGSASAWSTFLRERFALPGLVPMSLLLAASTQYVVADAIRWGGLGTAAVGVTLLLTLLRLMDEVKDLDTDVLAHPERPLARGLLTRYQAESATHLGLACLAGLALTIALVGSPLAGGIYLACVVLAALMYREFFVPAFLSARPALYAGSHQVIVLVLYTFATATAFPSMALTGPVLWFGMAGLAASFLFEVSRKLDPDAHPALRTYREVYGLNTAIALIVLAMALLAFSTYRVGVHLWVWPALAVLGVSLTRLHLRPERFRIVEAMAGLTVLAQLASPTLSHLLAVVR